MLQLTSTDPLNLEYFSSSSCKMSATWREDTHHTETQKGQTLRERAREKEAARERRRQSFFLTQSNANSHQMQLGTKAWTFSVPPLHFFDPSHMVSLIFSTSYNNPVEWPCGHNFWGRFTIVPHKLNPLLCCKSRPRRLHLKIAGVDISSDRYMIFRPSGVKPRACGGHVQPKLKITLVVYTRSFEDYSSGFMWICVYWALVLWQGQS